MWSSGAAPLGPLQTQKVDGVTLVQVPAGPLEATGARDFMTAMRPVLQESTNVVLDLGEVTFIDSPGLVTLLSCLRHVAAREGDVKLCGIRPAVNTVFASVGMGRIFDIYATRDEALKAFAAGKK